MVLKFPLLFLGILLVFGCHQNNILNKTRNESTDTTVEGYFHFDRIDHYVYINSTDDILKKAFSSKLSIKDSIIFEALTEMKPRILINQESLLNYGSLGYSLGRLDTTHYKKISRVFSKEMHDERNATSCMPIFRDILIFRNNNEINGIAKVCFDCGQVFIIKSDTSFDHWGEIGLLKKTFNN